MFKAVCVYTGKLQAGGHKHSSAQNDNKRFERCRILAIKTKSALVHKLNCKTLEHTLARGAGQPCRTKSRMAVRTTAKTKARIAARTVARTEIGAAASRA